MIKFRNISKRFGAGAIALTLIASAGCSLQPSKENSESKHSSHSSMDSDYAKGRNIVTSSEAIRNMESSYEKSSYIEPSNEESSYVEPSYESSIEENARLEESSYFESSIYYEEELSMSISSEESKKKVSKKDVITFLESVDEKISDKSEKVANDVIDGCKIAYDFVFKGGTIKGYTLDELEDTMQQKAITIVAKIDSKIDKHIPGYKDKIKEFYGNTKEKIVAVATKYGEKFKNKIKEILGEEKYESYVSVAEELNSISEEILHDDWETLKDAWGYIKGKVKKKS